MHLLLTDDGQLTGTYEDIALVVGRNGETIRKWAKWLEEKELIEVLPMGKNIQLVLTEPSMNVAKSPDYKIREIQASHPDDSPQMKKCRIMVDACNASGSGIWMQIEPEKK